MEQWELIKNKKIFAAEFNVDPNNVRTIPKSELVVGYVYAGHCRNANHAIWLGDKFEYTRYKWGSYFKETINHFEDDDGYDVFVPMEICKSA